MKKHSVFVLFALWFGMCVNSFAQSEYRTIMVEGKAYKAFFQNNQLVGFGDEQDFEIPDHIATQASTKRSLRKIISSKSITPYNSKRSVAPLMTTEWGQEEPFNNGGPLISGKYSPTGCVNIALAQLLYFHRCPSGSCMSETVSYTTSTKSISLSQNYSNLKFDWSRMRDTYISKDLTKGTETISKEPKVAYISVGLSSTSVEGKQCILTLSKLANISKTTINCSLRFLLFDNNDNYVCPLNVEKLENRNNWTSGSLFNEYNMQVVLPNGVANGNYRIYLASKDVNSNVWNIAKVQGTGTLGYVSVKKQTGSFTIEGKTFTCGYTAAEAEEVAKLVKAIGIANRTDYREGGSTGHISNYIDDFRRIFRVDDGAFILRKGYVSDKDWHMQLQKQLVESLPVFYGGNPASTKVSGHDFIIDGYEYIDNEPWYHVNWGWDGRYNGYFQLSSLIPDPSSSSEKVQGANYGYQDECMILNFKPEDGKTAVNQFGVNGVSLSKTSVDRRRFFTITYTNYRSLCGRPMSGYISMRIKKKGAASSSSDAVIASDPYLKTVKESGDYINSRSINAVVPATLAAGDYEVYPVFTETNGKEAEVWCDALPQLRINDGSSYGGSNIAPEVEVSATGFAVKSATTDKVQFTLSNVESYDTNMMSGEVGILIAKSDGTFVTEAVGEPSILNGGTAKTFTQEVSIPYLSDGNYRFYIGYKRSGSAKWSYVEKIVDSSDKFNSSTSPLYIDFTSSNGVATIGTYKVEQPFAFAVTTSADGYATFFDSKYAYLLPTGLKAKAVTGIDSGKLLYATVADGSSLANSVLPANVPVILESKTKAAKQYSLQRSKTSNKYSGKNMLRGSDDDSYTVSDSDEYMYKLTYGPKNTAESNLFGWYWGATNGGSFLIPAHKAWLCVPKSATTRAGYLDLDSQTTSITSLDAMSTSLYYDLQGRCVGEHPSDGLYIKNGKKVFVK